MARSCRVGVHGRNDVEFYEADYQAIRKANIEVLKMMSQTRVEHFQNLQAQNPGLEFITRLYDGNNFGPHGHPNPEDFAQRMVPVMNQLRTYSAKFEIHNEPNHMDRIEGWGDRDEDARSFNAWFLRTYTILKHQCPWAQLGFPGLAIPHRDLEWIEICRPAIERADWLGVHAYWQTPPGQERNHLVDFWGLRFKYYNEKFPDKIIDLTEVGNSNVQNNISFTEESHAREFTEYLTECFKYPYLNSASFFILSSQDPSWDGFTWRSENGRPHQVVQAVGRLFRPMLVPARGSTGRIDGQEAGPVLLPPPIRQAPGPDEVVQLQSQLQALQNQNIQLQDQLQQLQIQNIQLQAHLNQLRTENAQLRNQIQQLQSQPPPGVGVVPPPPPAVGVSPHRPPIQNITRQLAHHPRLQYKSRSLSQIDRIIIHHTAILPRVGAERIAEHLVTKKGRPGIGYHYFITGDGLIQQTNALTTISHHAIRQFNQVAIGIGFAGNFMDVAPAPAQIEAGARLIAWLISKYNLNPGAVFGYKELINTQSPGTQWDSGAMWGAQLRQKIRGYLAGAS